MENCQAYKRKDSCEYNFNTFEENTAREEDLVHKCSYSTLSEFQQSKNSLIHNKGHANGKIKLCNIRNFNSTQDVLDARALNRITPIEVCKCESDMPKSNNIFAVCEKDGFLCPQRK